MRRFVAIAVLAGCLPAFSWGPEGHNLVARLAEARLTSEARARVAAILGPNTSLASISSWPDQIRRARPETAPWHYIDIPIDKPRLDMARDCPKGDCVLAKIEDFRKALRDPAITAEQRKEALMFLVHFIGDMHQPLHCSDNKDKGGNGVQTQFFGKPMNLHSVWDGGLLGRMGAEDQLFAAFSKDLTPGRTKKLSQGTVSDWAEQSHKASQKIVYGKLAKVAAGKPVPISEAYEKAADPLIKDQIEKAGARLAAVLNAALQ
jgi:hypothetical protein